MTKNPFEQFQFDKLNLDAFQAPFGKIAEEANSLGRENLDAFVRSGTIFANGVEKIVREGMSFAQSTSEKQAKLVKQALASKNVTEFSEAQNKLAQTGFDDFMTGATKISEIGVKVLTDAVEPINDQLAKSVQKASEAVAAE